MKMSEDFSSISNSAFPRHLTQLSKIQTEERNAVGIALALSVVTAFIVIFLMAAFLFLPTQTDASVRSQPSQTRVM
jgi:hypothetical protein